MCRETREGQQRLPNPLLVLMLMFLCLGCMPQSATPPQRINARPAPRAANTEVNATQHFKTDPNRPVIETRVEHGVHFEEVAATSGINFQYESGAQGKELMVEAMGGGVGWIDYDQDGLQDIYFVQGGNAVALTESVQPEDQFFRNTDNGRSFVNVTLSAGLGDRAYGQGVTIGDFDNDGFDDLYVTNFSHNVLYHNQGDGTFANVTETAGVDDTRWSTGAAWADLDRDGDLDLYVCNYLKWDVNHPQVCIKPNGQPGICHPSYFESDPDECFVNLGDGRFAAQATALGLIGADSKSLGVAIADFNNDGWPDIFVAIDTRPNFLFINDGTGHFRELAVEMGCAVNANGLPQACMGIAVGDFDRNGFLDLYVTNFKDEYNTLYQNLGSIGMDDVTQKMGLVKPTLPFLGFGTVMADFDQDGWPELFVANGHISDLRHIGTMWEMTPQVFTYRAPARRWFEISAETGGYSQNETLGRGVATADFDNDGDLDLVVVPQNRPAQLLRNDSRRGHWLKLICIGRRGNRSAIGVRATVRSGPLQLMQEVAGGTSYCSSHQHSLLFGFGIQNSPCELELRWPGGEIQTFTQLPLDQTLTLIEP